VAFSQQKLRSKFMEKLNAAITGVHGYVPDYVLTNEELETMVDTTDEWILTRTGIKERRILKGEGKGCSDLAAGAVKGLCEKMNMDPNEIDLLIVCTVTGDYQFPATANVVCDKIGAKNAFGFDINAACSGFLYGLVTGSQFIETGKHKKVVVVGSDKMSAIVDYEDRQTCVIFGDGAGAVLLEPTSEDVGIQDSILRSDGSGRHHLHQKAGGSVRPASHETIDAREHYIYQEGQTVFKFAVKNMADVSAEIMERNNLTADDISWLVPHQANLRIIDACGRRMGLDPEKVMINIEKFGNTTSGTIPLCLWEWENKLNKGDNIVLAAFGGGFTWGSVLVKWAYDSKTNN
jgi:3-oxoacyl-[acyl-carrier-protein] synthase-3